MDIHWNIWMKYDIWVCLKVTLEDGAIGERRLVTHDLKVVETESYHSLHLFCMFVISFNKMLLERAEINNKHNRKDRSLINSALLSKEKPSWAPQLPHLTTWPLLCMRVHCQQSSCSMDMSVIHNVDSYWSCCLSAISRAFCFIILFVSGS